jgi:hypothetical protein
MSRPRDIESSPAETSWLTIIKPRWQVQPLVKPEPDPLLEDMTAIERSAETLRYSLLRAEFFISPQGHLREWLRLNLFIALILGSTSVLIVPIVTFVLTEFTTWTSLLVKIVKNLLLIPSGILASIALFSAVVFILRLMFFSRR